MNEIVSKSSVAGNKFMPETHLRHPGFTYSVCRPLTKNKEEIETFKETGYSQYIYQTKQFFFYLCFFHEHSRLTGQQEKGEGIYLTPLYRFHLIHRHLDIMKLSGGLLQREITKNQIRNIMAINLGLLQWFVRFFDKNIQVMSLYWHSQKT